MYLVKYFEYICNIHTFNLQECAEQFVEMQIYSSRVFICLFCRGQLLQIQLNLVDFIYFTVSLTSSQDFKTCSPVNLGNEGEKVSVCLIKVLHAFAKESKVGKHNSLPSTLQPSKVTEKAFGFSLMIS